MLTYWIIVLVVPAVVLLAAWVAVDLARNSAIKALPADPETRLPDDIDGLLVRLEGGGKYDPKADYAAIDAACGFMDRRWDTSDFRLPTLIRLLWLHAGKLDGAARDRIKGSLLGFKYWIDQPGKDSMCYWSENHQVLFATGEYLAGKLFADETFTNDGRTGREHMAIARERLMTWLDQRWKYGFIEWYSNTYYVEDAAPLACLVDFAGDSVTGVAGDGVTGVAGDGELATKAAIALDLLMYDLASQSWKGSFVSTMGRGYEQGKKGPGDSLKDISACAFGTAAGPKAEQSWWKLAHGMEANLILSRRYRVPAAIKAVAAEPGPALVRASTGLELAELRGKDLLGTTTPQMMMLWGMEAFTNPEAIATSVRYAHKYELFGNEFLHDLSMVDIGLLRTTGLLGPVSRMLRPVSDGVAIQRANTYTYRTPDWQLASVQRHQAGGFGDQQHMWSALVAPGLAVFTTNPAKSLLSRGALSESPGYWVGNGRNPDLVQDRNVVLAIYVVEGRKGFMEKSMEYFSHAWFPKASFDEASVAGRMAFARKGNTYIALLGASELSYAEGEGAEAETDLLQRGGRSAWACELGSAAEDGSYAAFRERVSHNAFAFDAKAGRLSYESGGRKMELVWRGSWTIDGKAVATDYPRFDSPWAKAPREPEAIEIVAGGKRLRLDYGKVLRSESTAP